MGINDYDNTVYYSIYNFIIMYYSVLWYKENPLIIEYMGKYFLKLKDIFNNLPLLPEDTKNKFKALTQKEQEAFMLHPDISSLLQETIITNHTPSERKFIEELQMYLEWRWDTLTMYRGENIPGTEIKLTREDNNPHNGVTTHPGHTNDGEGIMWWWEKSQEEWLDVFWKAFEVLKVANEDFFDELNAIIKKIVPMRTSLDVHHSCSYKECIGTLYLGFTINSPQPEINILEALVHESSHNKLNLIMQDEPLHTNDFTLKYYSPYRPDARHIHGVYLWVHAIVPTVYVMLEAIEKGYLTDTGIKEKVVLYHIKNRLGHRVLEKYTEFTEIWKSIFEDMWKIIAICDQKIKSNKELQNLDFKNIQRAAKIHFLDVQHDYPHVQY